MSKKIRKEKCTKCGADIEVKLICEDCEHSFTNPFDELICRKGRTGRVTCKEFRRKK